MRKIKKYIPLLLALLCIAGMLTGCKIEMPNQTTSHLQVSEAVNGSSLPESTMNSAASSQIDSASSANSEAASSAVSSSKDSDSAGSTSQVTKSDGSSVSGSPKSSSPLQNTQATCTLYIDCKTLLSHLNEVDAGTKSIVPKDGVIYSAHTVTFKSGETVFNVLNREMKANGIKFNFQSSGAYNSVYVTEIGGIGQTLSQSGWMYRVNGKYINLGCSLVKLKNGDRVEWHYTCENGRDLV